MKAVNMATQFTVDMFMRRAAALPFEEHPYHAFLAGLTGSAAETVKERREKMQEWITETICNSVSLTLNETLAVIRIANAGSESDKKAAADLIASMGLMEKMATVFVNDIDFDHVTDAVIEDGRRRVAEATNVPAEQAKKPEPKSPIQNWSVARWAPSAN
jgi:hypothetical protein